MQPRIYNISLLVKATAFVLVGALAVGGGAVAAQMSDPRVSVGDRVTYHVYAYRASDDVLVYTTDLERATVEVEAGNADLPLLPPEDYGSPTREVVLTDGELDPVRALLGYQVGSIARTAVLHAPFGVSENLPTTTFPRVLGPIPLEFTIDIEDEYAEDSKSWFKLEVARTEIEPGARLAYVGGSLVDVVDVVGQSARLRLVMDESTPDVVRSRGLDIPFRIEPITSDAILLHADLEVGQSFDTTGCSKQGIVLQKGGYTVEEITAENVTVRARPSPALAPVIDEDLRFEFRVVALEKWPHAKVASAFGPLASLWPASHSTQHHEE